MSLIIFLLSYRLFVYEIVYALSRSYTGTANDPICVYYELHLGDWWWNIQERLLDGATVVPIILAVNKT
jgi:hypothetical protein